MQISTTSNAADTSVTVIVVTRNRVRKLFDTLKSIQYSTISDFELIIVDQSDKSSRSLINKVFGFKNLLYFHQQKTGLSVGRNLAVKYAHGNILCFTDDDCIVDPEWIENIQSLFEKEKDVLCVFGSTKPFEADLNRNAVCPCVFTTDKERIVNKPCLHYKYIGFGNNMSFRIDAFNKYGLFKEWLGVGSMGLSAEDAEFVNRLLVNNKKVLTTKKAIVYHNKWLLPEQTFRQSRLYICGELSCYGYFALRGYKFGQDIVINNIKLRLWKIKRSLKEILQLKGQGISSLCIAIIEMIFALRGLLIAAIYTFKESRV